MHARNESHYSGGWLFHVLNRGNARMELFQKDADYHAFEVLLGQTLERFRMRLLAYCHAFTHRNELHNPAAGASPVFKGDERQAG